MSKLKELIKKILIKRVVRNGLKIGEGCSFAGFPDFGTEPYLITIGNRVRFSGKIIFLTHDGSTWVFRNLEQYKNVIKYGEINIGDNCFIGHSCIIMPNVTIGKNSIIGAGSIVTKSFPEDSVIAGVPAKRIMSTCEYANKCLKNTPVYDTENMALNKKNELLKIFGNKR